MSPAWLGAEGYALGTAGDRALCSARGMGCAGHTGQGSQGHWAAALRGCCCPATRKYFALAPQKATCVSLSASRDSAWGMPISGCSRGSITGWRQRGDRGVLSFGGPMGCPWPLLVPAQAQCWGCHLSEGPGRSCSTPCPRPQQLASKAELNSPEKPAPAAGMRFISGQLTRGDSRQPPQFWAGSDLFT